MFQALPVLPHNPITPSRSPQYVEGPPHSFQTIRILELSILSPYLGALGLQMGQWDFSILDAHSSFPFSFQVPFLLEDSPLYSQHDGPMLWHRGM